MKLVVGVLVLCGCMSPVMTFGAGKSAEEAQHDRLTELMPIALATEGPWRGEVRVAKLRVYADDDFRSQNVHWERTFGEELEYANAVLGSQFGVRLEAEYKVWDRHATASTLPEDIEALAAMDPGTDVLSVVGLTSALTLATATFDQIGYASVPGRHLVLRGYAEVGERKLFEGAFPKLRPDERDTVVEARRRHKTASTLLHELAHNFGAPHEDDPDTLMSSQYSHHASGFSDSARTIIQTTLDRRLGGGHDAHPAEVPVVARHHKSQPLVFSITSAGDVIFNGEPIEVMKLDIVLTTVDTDTEIVIKRAHTAPSSATVQLVDRAKSKGLSHFTIGNE